jgi:hypothetical protein
MEKQIGIWYCHATYGHRKTTIFTSSVFGPRSVSPFIRSYFATMEKVWSEFVDGVWARFVLKLPFIGSRSFVGISRLRRFGCKVHRTVEWFFVIPHFTALSFRSSHAAQLNVHD